MDWYEGRILRHSTAVDTNSGMAETLSLHPRSEKRFVGFNIGT